MTGKAVFERDSWSFPCAEARAGSLRTRRSVALAPVRLCATPAKQMEPCVRNELTSVEMSEDEQLTPPDPD